MKIKWRLYVDIYDILTRKDLPAIELATGTIKKKEEFKDLIGQIVTLLPKDANYFKDSVATVRTTSLTLESPLSFSSDNENHRKSPGLVLEPDSEGPNTQELQAIMQEHTKNLSGIN
jgi:hypothetical protein